MAVAEYEAHVKNIFPRFTIKDCEACHVDSTHDVYTAGRRAYDVPDQTKSMPGVLSGTVTIANRDVANVSKAVTGPAVRACGACHRAQAINADDQLRLQTQITHWQTFGSYVETAVDATTAEVTALWAAIVDKLMSLFPNGDQSI